MNISAKFRLNLLLVLGALVVVVSMPVIAAAQLFYRSNVDYSQAYSICSPVAHQMAKKQCNYGRIYEGYYLQCMYNQGYGEEESLDKNYYDGYFVAYKYCSSVSDQSTKEYCGYGRLYNTHYNRCMIRHGFNANGEPLNNGKDGQRYFEYDF